GRVGFQESYANLSERLASLPNCTRCRSPPSDQIGIWAMLISIAGFELRYQMHNPVFWVATIMFFLLTFGSMTMEVARMAGGGNVHINSPVAIAEIHLTMS